MVPGVSRHGAVLRPFEVLLLRERTLGIYGESLLLSDFGFFEGFCSVRRSFGKDVDGGLLRLYTSILDRDEKWAYGLGSRDDGGPGGF